MLTHNHIGNDPVQISQAMDGHYHELLKQDINYHNHHNQYHNLQHDLFIDNYSIGQNKHRHRNVHQHDHNGH